MPAVSGHQAPVDLRQAARATLPVLAIVVPIAAIGAILVAAGNTLGYDYLMYDGAARRLMAGGPLYDLSFAAPGPNGLFDYPRRSSSRSSRSPPPSPHWRRRSPGSRCSTSPSSSGS